MQRPIAATVNSPNVRICSSLGFVVGDDPTSWARSARGFLSHWSRASASTSTVSSPCLRCLRQVEGRKLEPAGYRLSVMVQGPSRSEEHTSELQSLMRISYAVFCL